MIHFLTAVAEWIDASIAYNCGHSLGAQMVRLGTSHSIVLCTKSTIFNFFSKYVSKYF